MESLQNTLLNTSSRSAVQKDLQPSIQLDDSVGPGAYSLPPLIPQGPSYSFPQAGRFQTPKNESKTMFPSITPEKYRDSPKKTSKSVPPSFSRTLLFQISESPGPGQYLLPSTLYNNYFTIKGKPKEFPVSSNPGPGAYEVIKSPSIKFPVFTESRLKSPEPATIGVKLLYPKIYDKGVSYSMRSRPKSTPIFEVPGPGAYYLPSVRESAKISITGRIKSPSQFNTPGPGSYTINLRKTSPEYSMGLPYKKNANFNTPGPADYQISGKTQGPQYSMRQRFVSSVELDNRDFANIPSSFGGRSAIILGKPKERVESSPGPGSYSPKLLRKGLAYSQPRSSRNPKIEESPGPGHYDNRIFSDSPSYSIRKRHDYSKTEETPGPGNYDFPSKKVSAPLLRGKPKDTKNPDTPGPAHYNPSHCYKTLSFSQSCGTRFKEIPETPGPGAFSPKWKSHAPSFSFTSRAKPAKEEKYGPGPGSYHLPSTLSKFSATLKGKPKDPQSSLVPGPGHYSTEDIFAQTKGFSIGQSDRHDPSKNSKEFPGPGAYEPERARSVSYSFSKEKRAKELVDNSPGPGSYDFNFPKGAKSFTLLGKPKPEAIHDYPGPNKYNIPQKQQSSAYSFGAKLPLKSETPVPGPGAYYFTTRSLSPAWTIGKRYEFFLESENRNDLENSPGPGSYQPAPLNSSISYTFGSKYKEKDNNNPGPGTYESPAYKTGMVTMGSKFLNKIPDGPGPGSYNIPEKSGSPAWKISSRLFSSKTEENSGWKSSSRLFPQKNEDLPGPGQYYLTSLLSSKGFTFSKLESKPEKKEIPGPGQYNTDKIRPESPAFSLGKGPRVDFTKLATKTPGPGEYKLGSSFNGKAAKFSSAKRISVFDVESSSGYYKIEKKPDGPFYTIQGKRSENNKNLTPVIII